MKRIASIDIQTIDPTFSADIITWQKQFGRHALPWQNTRDAYRIWLSEIMLQQTQVAAVIPYYQKFLLQFPTVQALAEAPSEAVMSLWSGLGYYTRARNLHRCAQRVVAEHGGIFPADVSLLEALPGIGRSTAAAISAFAYGTRAAILDGNVKRVFCRVFGVAGYPGSKPIEDALWRRADQLLPATEVGAYTQGLMDLGATLCTRSRPSCVRCPLASRCIALATGQVHLLPERKPKKITPTRQTAMLVIVDQGQVLLIQRPDSGIWGGLLSLPEIGVDELDRHEAGGFGLQQAMAAIGEPQSVQALTPFEHGFTHFKLQVSPYLIHLARRFECVAQANHVWYGMMRLADAPLPAPVKKLLLAIADFDHADNLFSV